MVNLQTSHFYPLQKDEFSLWKMRSPDIFWCTIRHPLHSTGASVNVCEMNIMQRKQIVNSCTTRDIPAKLYWIEMHQQNSWIYSTPESTKVNVNCDYNTIPITLRGSGMIKLPERYIIHDQTMTVVGRQTMTTKLKSSFLPSFNLSQHLTSFNIKKLQPILKSNDSLDISALENAIRLQKSQKYILKEIRSHRIHQYSLFGVNGCLIIIVNITIIIFVILRKRSQRKIVQPHTAPTKVTTIPMRTLNKGKHSQTSFEYIDFYISSI